MGLSWFRGVPLICSPPSLSTHCHSRWLPGLHKDKNCAYLKYTPPLSLSQSISKRCARGVTLRVERLRGMTRLPRTRGPRPPARVNRRFKVRARGGGGGGGVSYRDHAGTRFTRVRGVRITCEPPGPARVNRPGAVDRAVTASGSRVPGGRRPRPARTRLPHPGVRPHPEVSVCDKEISYLGAGTPRHKCTVHVSAHPNLSIYLSRG